MIEFYAGIGSREAPLEVLYRMTEIARQLRKRGWWLRSGHAPGSDRAFELGCGGVKEIFRARDATEEAMRLASEYHPKWAYLTEEGMRLHGRNGMILLGRNVLRPIPVRFIVCWTVGGLVLGGTGQALRMAADPKYAIPVFNLFHPDAEERMYECAKGFR